MDADRVEAIVCNVEFAADSLARLRDKQGVSFEAYRADSEFRDVVERRFEKLIEPCIKIA